MSLRNQLSRAIISGDNKKVSDVLAQMNGEEVNEMNGYGTALHQAVSGRNNRAVFLLLAKPGINVNARNESGLTPLHKACKSNNYRAVPLLLGCAGIEVNAKDNNGCTPIMMAARMDRKEVLGEMLKSPQVDLDVKDNEMRGLEELSMIKEEKLKRKSLLAKIKQKIGEKTVVGMAIEKIETISKNIEEGEQRQKGKVEDRKLKRKQLDERQSLEMERLAKKHRKEKSAMEKTFNAEDKDGEHYLANLNESRKDLTEDIEKKIMDLSNGDKEASREAMECPVCMETMKPPTRIWMCRDGHAICETCKDNFTRLKGEPHPSCPTCKSKRVNQRAIIFEKLASSVFNS